MKIRHKAQKFLPAFILFLFPCLPIHTMEAKENKARLSAKAEEKAKKQSKS